MNDEIRSRLLTPDEVGERLGIGRTTVFQLLHRGDLLSVRIGRLRRVPESALTAYVQHLSNLGEQRTRSDREG